MDVEVRTERAIKFPLLLRDPSWSRATSVVCDGAEISRVGGYWVVTKKWTSGDRIAIKFAPMVQEIAAVNGEVALQYGALLFCQPIDAEKIVVKRYPIEGFEDAHFAPIAGKYEELMLPAKLRWQGFGLQPVQLTQNIDLLRPFDRPLISLQGKMIRSVDGRQTPVTLVPLGNACTLRRLTFPISS